MSGWWDSHNHSRAGVSELVEIRCRDLIRGKDRDLVLCFENLLQKENIDEDCTGVRVPSGVEDVPIGLTEVTGR